MPKRQQQRTEPWRATTPATNERASSRARVDRAEGEVPEWETEAWKRRVEAEARARLKHQIRDVGSA